MSTGTIQLRDARGTWRARCGKIVRFGAVGASGILVNTAALAATAEVFHLHYVLGALISTQVSTTYNYVLLDRLLFRDAGRAGGGLSRYLRFSSLNHASFVVRGPLLLLFTELVGLHYLASNVAALTVLFALRYTVSDQIIWSDRARTLRSADLAPASIRAIRSRGVPLAIEAPWPWPARIAMTMAVVSSSVLLRTWKLDAVGFNSDEAVYAGQAASVAGDLALVPYFPAFRAHPLLFQSLLSIPYQFGTSPLVGRLLSAAFGVATVAVCYLLGRELYNRKVGAVAGLLLAVMPYHAVVTRQVLLDGPMAFFATVSLWFLARFARTQDAGWLVAAGAAFGLTFLAKETSIVLIGGAYLFLAMSPSMRVPLRALLLSMVTFVALVLPFPLALKFSGRTSTGEAFLTWQLFRRANHPWTFYMTTVPPALGYLVVIAAVVGTVLLWRRRTWRESLLLCWIAVPVAFFQVWPVKGWQYLLPIAPAVAVLAARALVSAPLFLPRRVPRRLGAACRVALVAGCAVSLVVPTWRTIVPGSRTSSLAGAGGIPGGREAGQWVATNVPVGARLLAIGPSMANIMQFYGGRKAYGLSVSSNPLHRNPVYEPVPNADLQLRSSEIQYLVWDSFSAARSPFFSKKLLTFAERYHGRVVHSESVVVDGVEKPVIVIYAVRP